jgi:hypothetical protein
LEQGVWTSIAQEVKNRTMEGAKKAEEVKVAVTEAVANTKEAQKMPTC